MTNRIDNGPQGPDLSGADALGEVEAESGAEEASFSEAVAGHEATAPISGSELEAAVDDVAADLAAGRLSGPEEAFGAVVDRLVELRFAHIDPSVRGQMGQAVRVALGDDPFLSLEVEAMIGDALERVMGGSG